MIRKINSGQKFEHRHRADVVRIQTICLLNGYEAELQDCADIWDEVSDSFAAGWLRLPDTDIELWDQIESRVENKAR